MNEDHVGKTVQGEQFPVPPPYDPEARHRAYEDRVVGPDGKTRAEVRVLMLEHLAGLTEEVILAQGHGIIDPLEGFKLRLRIHRERCALVGIPTGIGEPW